MQRMIEIVISAFLFQALGGVIFILYAYILKKMILDAQSADFTLSRLRRYIIGLGIPSICVVLQIIALAINPEFNWGQLIILVVVIYAFISTVYVLNQRSFFDTTS